MTMFVSNGKSDEDGYQETIDSLKDELAACEKELADLKSHDHAPCVLCDPLRQQLAASEKEANKWFVLHQALEKEVERLSSVLSAMSQHFGQRITAEEFKNAESLPRSFAGYVEALEQRVIECEGLLRNALSHADDIDVYFERRKP